MATGTITVINPNGRTGTVRVISVDSEDRCPPSGCVDTEIDFVQPNAPGVGSRVIGKIVEAGGSGVYIMINLTV